jgi:Effector protein
MIRFDPYPITINGSRKDDEIRAALEERVEKGEITEIQKIEELSRLEPNQWDYVAESSPWAENYEKRVSALLSFIRANHVGRCLLQLLRAKGTLRIWIIPYDSDMVEMMGEGNANVTWAPEKYAGAKAVRMAYSPEFFTYASWGRRPGSRADEVLFHEMVHAYRYANPSIKKRIYIELPGYTDHEEFIAHQLSNVYRSTRGAHKFNLDYKKKALATADECEKALRSSRKLTDAMALFLDTDPLAKAVANLHTLYNPFATFQRQRP